MECSKCGQRWPDTEALGAGCPFCLLAFAFKSPAPPPAADPEAETPLSHLGPYTIRAVLGRGGMGIVYQARHEGLNRSVALKVLHTASARRKGFPERFQREGQMLAVLNHPNIVRVHDLGCEAGVYYLAMEEVVGTTLRQTLRQGPLPWERALPLFVQLCDGLQHAHDCGVIHRDIKPENVLIEEGGQIKIADFGVGKLLGDGSDLLLPLTESGALIGTRCYTAPEQLEGSRAVDHRADLYALGVVLYEMLTGELPLGVFPPPSRKARLDERLDAIVLRSLAKEPGERYASAREFKAEILSLARPAAAGGWRLSRSAVLRFAGLAGLLLAAMAWVTRSAWDRGVDLNVTSARATPASAATESPPSGKQPPSTERARARWVLAGHKARVWAVAFAPDSRSLATAGEDRMVRVWGVAQAREQLSWEAFPRGELGYLSLAYAPNGKRLATAGGEGTVRLWDTAKRQELLTLPGHSREVNALAFSPDGLTLASAGHDKHVKLWDPTTGKLGLTLSNSSDAVLCVAYSPDGRWLAGSAMTGGVKLWEPTTGKDVGNCGHARRVWAIAFAPKRELLATGSHDRTIKLWDLSAKPFKPKVLEVGSEVWALAASPSGQLLASGSHDGAVRLWDLDSGELVRQLSAHQGPVVSVAFSPDGRYLASGSWDQTAVLWDVDRLLP
jgi:serine/threonine protein kinase